MLRYKPRVDDDLDDMLDELDRIANLTQGAEEKVVFMKDSSTSAQKSSQPGKGLLLDLIQFKLWLRDGSK